MAVFKDPNSLNFFEIRDAIPGNRRLLNLHQRIKRSMNGAIWAYAHKPATIVQKMQFEHENRPTMIAFIGFLNQYKGMQLEYIDHDARTWLGYVMNLPFEETHISHANNAFEIEFEGVLQPYTISVADVIPPKT